MLLNNLLYDVSELAIPADSVADADLAEPPRWDSDRVRRAMLTFGPLSSGFDLLAFALLIGVLHVAEAEFQSAWFVLSLATQVLVIFVLRTARPCWRDRPSPALALTSVATVALAAGLPWLPGATLFGLIPLPPAVLATLAVLTLAYLIATEAARLLVRPGRRCALPNRSESRANAEHGVVAAVARAAPKGRGAAACAEPSQAPTEDAAEEFPACR